MAKVINVFVFVMLAVVTITLAQVSQGGGQAGHGGPHQNQGRAKRSLETFGQESQGGGHPSQGGPHENQGRTKREASNADEGTATLLPWANGNPNWTTCDVTTTPVISCHNCTTRLICTQVGGKLITCNGPFKSYCNNGICSPIPSPGCA